MLKKTFIRSLIDRAKACLTAGASSSETTVFQINLQVNSSDRICLLKENLNCIRNDIDHEGTET